jgi:hypothetical protein
LVSAISVPLIGACAAHAGELLGSVNGSRVLAETLEKCEGDKTSMLEAVAKAAVDGASADDDDSGGPASTPHGSRVLQRMIRATPSLAPSLTAALLSSSSPSVLDSWAQSKHMAFVVARLAAPEVNPPKQLLAKLNAIRDDLNKLAKEGNPGVKVLIEAMDK